LTFLHFSQNCVVDRYDGVSNNFCVHTCVVQMVYCDVNVRSLTSIQDRQVACYSISCKEQHNIGIAI